MKSTQRQWRAATTPQFAPEIDEARTLSKEVPTASACVIEFFEARNSLTAGFEEGRKEFEKWKASKVAASRLPSLRRIDRVGESLYWLLSAATLVYLLLALIGF